MAGHSKWANIQHRKNTQDAKRGKLFTWLIREITVAARMGGGDPMPTRDCGWRWIRRWPPTCPRTPSTGPSSAASAGWRAWVRGSSLRGLRAGGVAVMVDAVTDNRNRTVAEVRHAFGKCGGNLGTSGSVAFQFVEQRVLSYPAGSDEDRLWKLPSRPAPTTW